MAKLALYPIYLYEEGTELPQTGTYYVVCGDGVYLHKETKIGKAFVKVKGVPWLENPPTSIELNLPKIPGRIIAQALTFFREVFYKYNSESYVTLLHSPTKGFRLWCPKQTVSHGSVNYDRTDQPSFAERSADNWQMIGTIHSHCDFSAFHSGVDTNDEASFDGIHITLGHVNRDQFSMVSSVVLNNQREQIEPEGCCDGVIRAGNKALFTSSKMSFGDIYFQLALSDEDAQGLIQDIEMITNEWMPKVEKEVWKGYQGGGHSSGGKFLGWNDLWGRR